MRFGGLVAVNDVSLPIAKGDLYGLIGPNGAGKTTLFNVITGVYEPTEGQVMFDGKDIAGCTPGRDQRPGHRPDLPEHPALPQHDACSTT